MSVGPIVVPCVLNVFMRRSNGLFVKGTNRAMKNEDVLSK